MNIFYLNHNQTLCAEAHVNSHNIKMILEYAQILSSTHRFLDGKEEIVVTEAGKKKKVWKLDNKDFNDSLYAITHINHPSVVWVRQSDNNYKWLHTMLVELCKEYTYRYGKIHKCEYSGLVDKLKHLPANIPVGEFTEPTPAMPDEYIVKNDSIQSYRNYYKHGKTHLHNWKNRPIPEFI